MKTIKNSNGNVINLTEHRDTRIRRGEVSVEKPEAINFFRRRLAAAAVAVAILGGAGAGVKHLIDTRTTPDEVMADNIIQDTYIRDNALVREKFAKVFEPLTNESGKNFLKEGHSTTIEQKPIKKALESYFKILVILNSEGDLDQAKKDEIYQALEIFDKALGQEGHNSSKSIDQLLIDVGEMQNGAIDFSVFIQRDFLILDNKVMNAMFDGKRIESTGGPSLGG